VAATRANLSALPGADGVVVGRRDFRERKGLNDAVIVVNPPYGLRLQRGQDLAGFYKELGDWLKFQCAGCTAYVYFGERQWLKSIGLRPSLKHPMRNGGLDGCVARYELYA